MALNDEQLLFLCQLIGEHVRVAEASDSQSMRRIDALFDALLHENAIRAGLSEDDMLRTIRPIAGIGCHVIRGVPCLTLDDVQTEDLP